MGFLRSVQLARDLHAGQVDKAGEPYIGHLLRVTEKLERGTPLEVLAAALLHDAVEDGKATLAELTAAGVPARSVELVDLLSRRDAESYEAYLVRLKADPDAVLVKRADLADNLDPGRLAMLAPDKAARLRAKYTKALEILNG